MFVTFFNPLTDTLLMNLGYLEVPTLIGLTLSLMFVFEIVMLSYIAYIAYPPFES